jgi:cysteine synthase
MFRTAVRSFAVSAWRNAESFSQLEAAHQTAINISKAQGVAQRGLLDGNISDNPL